MMGSITKDYSIYKITTGGATQDLALIFDAGVDDEKNVDFGVSWIKMVAVETVKKAQTSNAAIAEAVYELYSDAACTSLLTTMPATDSNGRYNVTLTKAQDTVYLEEIS
ncbi:MAG: hypothetical protein HFE90_11540 [Firmicutes bacterium]|nr:hypothetical protein [Bacillota bacterium]